MERTSPQAQAAIDAPAGSEHAQPVGDKPQPAGQAHWYKDAVVYQLHVKTFFDANDDGIGDFKGLTSRLDYVQDLGVNTVWLQPFYKSPLKDDGYDVADYHNVHPQYGTRADFRLFVREAHRRNLRVITELIVNHTSDQHPWFQAARRAPADSVKRAYYVWSDDPNRYAGTRIIFTDTEASNWAWDPVAGAYYWHRFFNHQPDLNFDNPRVLRAIYRTMRFWLDMGVDGFRLDAIPYLCEREGTNNENLPETHAVIKRIRALIDLHYSDRLLLAEANQWPEDVREYFGDGDECHMAYHFPLMPRMYMAIAQEDRHPVVEIMQQTPDIPDACQWAIFLRNHDELTLEMVTSRERDYMYRLYAADPRARVNLGIRRRLAPLMENDFDRIKLMNSLLLSMPGSPIVYYGDEIGMGDNIFLGDRNGVRTPMQWSPDRNAGFSRADPQRLYLPPIMDPVYGFQAVNVEAQLREPGSLLDWTRRMLAVRSGCRVFGRGRLEFLRPGNRKVLAYLRVLGDEVILCVANLARTAQPVELQLGRFRGRVPVEMTGRTAFPPIGELPYLLTLPKHGFYWFRLATDVEIPQWHEEMLPREEAPVVVLFDGWASFFRDRVVPWRIALAQKTREQLERELVPRFLESQRWFAHKGETVRRALIAESALWESGPFTWLLATFDIDGPAEPATYFLPLALAWEDREEERLRALAPVTLAKVRQQAEVGIMADAFADEPFCRAVVEAIGRSQEIAGGRGRFRFVPTRAYARLAGDDAGSLAVGRPQGQGTNSVVTLGDRLFLKGYRRLRPGVNPEVEIGRFLTEVVAFRHSVPVAGTVEYRDAEGRTTTIALLQAYVANQGDGWDYTAAYLERTLDAIRTDPAPLPPDVHGAYLARVERLGVRTAELHLALATRTGDPAFDPEPIQAADVRRWKEHAHRDVDATLALLARVQPTLPPPLQADAGRLQGLGGALHAAIAAVADDAPRGLRSRCHGDLHLGQVLIAKDDFLIIDFEGEPARPLEERRGKHSPLRDVAGMLRSFDYARWSALGRVAQSDDERRRLSPFAGEWAGQARSAFLAGYDATMNERAGAVGTQAGAGLLRLFELEKALYELAYEIGNRPAWIEAPLAGIVALLRSDDAADDAAGGHGD